VKPGRVTRPPDDESDGQESEDDEEEGVCSGAVRETSKARIGQFRKLLCRRCSKWVKRHFQEDFSAEEVRVAKLTRILAGV
jgi:hypothetical protein